MNNENPIKNISELIFPENVGREGASLRMRYSVKPGQPIIIGDPTPSVETMFVGANAFNGNINEWNFSAQITPSNFYSCMAMPIERDPITIITGKRMLVTETPYKINFIDHNDNFVGFSTDQRCCEDHGILIFTKLHRYWENSKLDKTNIGNYTFDVENQEISEEDEATIRSFVEKRIDHDEDDFSRELCIHIVRMKKGDGKRPAYLVMYNEHNGYYSHLVNSNINNVEFEENI